MLFQLGTEVYVCAGPHKGRRGYILGTFESDTLYAIMVDEGLILEILEEELQLA